jgi:hypothetical protein
MEVPDSLPEGFDGDGGPSQSPIQIGVDPSKGLVLIKVGDSNLVGLPIQVALQLAHNVNTKALMLLMGPPSEIPGDEPAGGGPRLVVP